MKKQTIALVIGIMFLGLASAMYAGNCQEVYLDFDNLDNVTYTSIGNQSDLEGLNVTLNGSYINICPVLNYKPDSFTLIFWDNSVKEVIKEVVIYSGGGTRTKYVYENITEYIEVEKIVYINDTLDCEEIDIPIVEEKIGFFERIWNWIKGLFTNGGKGEWQEKLLEHILELYYF